LPAHIIADFEEARQILPRSPAGSAASASIFAETSSHLGVPGDINAAIGTLVAEKRISPELQKAFDVVRVVGNEAVHPELST
jgi:hypothetical protein